MAVERRSTVLTLALNILEVPTQIRTSEHLDQIVKIASFFKFFQDILERQSSAEAISEIAKFLISKTFEPGEKIFQTGDPSNDFFFVLKGTVKILSNSYVDLEEPGDEDLHKMIRKTYELTHTRGSKEESEEIEVALLNFGESFGEMAIINEKPRYYSAECVERATVAVLHRNDYFKIEGTQEKLILEKMDFLRSMEEFKSWSKLSLYKLTFFFKEMKLRKGAVVYTEGDTPHAMYIIREGDFKFTQQFSIDAGNRSLVENKGSKQFKSVKANTIRYKELQVVTKQAGEIFGCEEIIEKLPSRQLTCKCISQTGKLLWISEKNFTKKITHPETNKLIEEQCSTFKAWVVPRLLKLKEIEIYKDGNSFTPYQKMKIAPRPIREVASFRVSCYAEFVDQGKAAFPVILKKIFTQRNASTQQSARHRKFNSTNSNMFATELDMDFERPMRGSLNATFYPSTARTGSYFPSKLSRVKKQKTNLL